jgi:hypothetical protein
MDLPDFDALLPDPARSRRLDDDGSALDAVLDGMSLVDLVAWVKGSPAVLASFEEDHADEIADYLADL